MIRKILCLLLALVLLLPAAAAAESSPASLRVLLRRLSLADRADLALTGRYLARAENGTELLLPENAKVTVLLENRQLTLFSGGISVFAGKTLSLLRQASGETEPGIRFNLQSGFYPGDLSLSVSEDRLQPVLTLPLEKYLQGVVPYEMGDGFPEEALKAQAVCARTYALSRVNEKNAWDVEDTAGLVLTCDGKLITAWYSASNGGQTELPANVWGGEAPRCFAMADDPWDTANPASTVRTCTLNRNGTELSPAFVKQLRQAALVDPALRERIPDEESFRLRELTGLELVTPRFPAPSRLMTQLKVSFLLPVPKATETAGSEEGDVDITALISALPVTVTLDLFPDTVISLGLSVSGANNEIITLQENETSFTLTAGRFGHGVGLSQRGAQQMAAADGKTFREILAFYFPGAVLKEYEGEKAPLPTPPPLLARDPGPAPTATPRPTLMPVTVPEPLPEGARLASVENIAEDSSLNLRAQPSAGAEILLRLLCHQKLLVLEKSDVPGWVRVRTDAAEGYVMESFLVYEEDPDAPKG